MSMQQTQKPATVYQVRQSSVTPPQKQHSNPNYMSCQKMRMSIIDQLSPIKDLPVNQSQRSSFYQVRGKSGSTATLMPNKTQPNRLLDSTSFNSTLNYTQESHFDKKSTTIPKGMKINNFEILKDQLRFAICQLEDLKKSFDKVVQSQFDQVIQVIKSSAQLSNQLVEENVQIRNHLNTLQSNSEYDKLKLIMEQLQQKITVLVNDNSKLNHQINYQQEENKKLISLISESDRKYQDLLLSTQNRLHKENMNPNMNQNLHINTHPNSSNTKGNYTQRELSYKLEQAEIKLLTLQISNDNLRQQLQHTQLDHQTFEQLKETITSLEVKSQSFLNQKDSLQQENDLLNQKISSLEKQLKDQSQKAEYIVYINQLENDLKQIRQEQINNHQTITSLNNTISQLKEQISILNIQKDQSENNYVQQVQSQQNELQQATSRYQILWQEISEMRERLEQRQISEDSHNMLSNAEKALFETQIQNLNDKIKDYEQILLHYESKSRQLEQQINQNQLEMDNYRRQLENMNNFNNNSLEIQELQWKLNQLNQIIQRKDKEYQVKLDELQSVKQAFDGQVKKNQNLEMRILHFMEQEVRNNSNLIRKQ
ncbi:unnamed protein product (macronuclear) [Paramecium tetraurelia]|uniref:Uncharacterized protein n=1 Tax=Paramecium tetraurelia TaxID=5888 RepID=A0DUR4_PARTE|nr:uncharacterized protein GSPATT00020453001 [Paramecium tetraurelia]CAK86781.1 unnamed protein product [Paramecium tetraurelia]|eukprot:XP_001454178.1 hypothetical protein (macronuclear) [Paramecium tetraurelia strain d4-2]